MSQSSVLSPSLPGVCNITYCFPVGFVSAGSRLTEDQRSYDQERARWEAAASSQQLQQEGVWKGRLDDLRASLHGQMGEQQEQGLGEKALLDR